MIEIRFVLAGKVQRTREREGVTQKELARRIGVAQSSISRVERASNGVSLDVAVRALINLGCADAEIAETFDVSGNAGIRQLRRRTERPCGPPPRGRAASAGEEHRFLRKGSRWLPRLK